MFSTDIFEVKPDDVLLYEDRNQFPQKNTSIVGNFTTLSSIITCGILQLNPNVCFWIDCKNILPP